MPHKRGPKRKRGTKDPNKKATVKAVKAAIHKRHMRVSKDAAYKLAHYGKKHPGTLSSHISKAIAKAREGGLNTVQRKHVSKVSKA